MTTVEEIAADYIDQMAEADPIAATSWGVPGQDHRLPDLSPAGIEARAAIERRALASLNALGAVADMSDDQRVAADVMAERLTVSLERHDAGEELRALRVLHSPQGQVRQCFDLMALDDEDDWRTAAVRMAAVPVALDQLRLTLEESIARGLPSPRRQVLACATQCDTWGGRDDRADSFFARLAARYPGGPSADALEAAAGSASDAFAALGPGSETTICPTPSRPTRSAATATPWRRATTPARRSTSTTPTRSGGTSSTASRTGCGRCASRSPPARRCTRRSSSWRATRPG
jgi:uncharacterized protein (DUF885 family)